MSQHSHHSPHSPSSPPHRKKTYADWRLIVAVILMLLAMIVYVLTMDDSLVPIEPDAPPLTQPANI